MAIIAAIDGWFGRRACDITDLVKTEDSGIREVVKYGLMGLTLVGVGLIALWLHANK